MNKGIKKDGKRPTKEKRKMLRGEERNKEMVREV